MLETLAGEVWQQFDAKLKFSFSSTHRLRGVMARRLRIQYKGALYHLLNRGNYRRDVFESDGAKNAFITTIEEACSRYGWLLHAYVVMRNHYHLAIRTPEANLVDGMHWMQSTFATRFNRYRSEHGHLFQGRYRAILLEDESVLSRVVDYIHLNPVRARLVEANALTAFYWSSLTQFCLDDKSSNLSSQEWLAVLGLEENEAGWNAYRRHLCSLADDPGRQKDQEFDQLSHGWAIGTDGWRNALRCEYAHQALSPDIEATQLNEMKQTRWSKRLEELLAGAHRTSHDLMNARKSAPWKVELATILRNEEGASIGWISHALKMGKPASLRNYLHRHARSKM